MRVAAAERSPAFKYRGAGFTLLELLLVLGILVTLAATAWPSYQVMVQERRLQAEAEALRNLFREARRQAMVDGLVYRCDFDWLAGACRVVPDSDPITGDPVPNKSDAGTLAAKEEAPPFRKRLELTPGVRFLQEDKLEDFLKEEKETEAKEVPADDSKKPSIEAPDSSEQEGSSSTSPANPSNGNWKGGAAFFPDGSTTEGTFIIADESKRYIKASLFPLTGEVEISDVQSREKKLEGDARDREKMKSSPASESGDAP